MKAKKKPNKTQRQSKKETKIVVLMVIILAVIAVSVLLFIKFYSPEPDGFVRIKGGTFIMGSPVNERHRLADENQRQVTISPFYMSKHLITQREYRTLMGINPSHFVGENLPVENVSFFDAVEFCNMRSRMFGLTPVYTITSEGTQRTVSWNRKANGYRLPTEAEWEYACRAGTTTPYNTGNTITPSEANINNVLGQTSFVGRYPPNAWGIYDTHGNVWEWVWDFYHPFPEGGTDPIGPSTGRNRVVRGGGWGSWDHVVRSARRDGDSYQNLRNYNLGFRIARNIR